MAGFAIRLDQLQGADKIWHLCQSTLFKGLTAREIASIAAISADQIFAKGQTIFDQGSAADSVIMLNRGCVRISILETTGREKIVGLLQTGDVFGEDLLSPQGTRQVRATAHEECWVSEVTKDDFLRLIPQRPTIALNLVGILSERMNEARDDIRALSFLDTENRVARTLINLGTVHGKYVASQKEMLKLKIAVSHEQLARMIGGNRPHISTIMSKFKKRGWIGYQGRKLLIDPEALSEVLRASELAS